MPNSLKSLFEAQSVAIVGVSEDPTKIGSVVLSNLTNAGYKGEIFPVNPKYTEVYGLPCYASVKDVPHDVDVVCIAVPQQFVMGVVDECVAKAVKSVVIITAGFAEAGEAGEKLETEVTQKLKKSGIRLLGPNCLGFIAPHENLNVSFAAGSPKAGNIAFLSQSGAFCTALLDIALPKNIGFSHLISIGNKADITENDLIEYLAQKDEVSVFGAYLEEIEDGRDWINKYSNLSKRKPFIVFKPGKSTEAQKAISSHTGSIAGSYDMFRTAMAQVGMIVAPSIRSMMNLLMAFSWAPLPAGNRVAIITNAGGPGIIATDAVIESGLQLAKLSETTQQQLKDSLPPAASLHNPIDILGDALADRFQTALRAAAADINVDSILVIVTPQLMTQIEDTAKLLVNTAKLTKKPIIPVFIGGKYVKNGLQRFYDNSIPAFVEIEDAIEVLRELTHYAMVPKSIISDLPTYNPQYRAEVQAVTTTTPTVLPNTLAEKLAKEFNIPLPPQILATTAEEAITFAEKEGEIVIKAPNDIIAHKTDVKAIYLHLKTPVEIAAAFADLSQNITRVTGKKPQNLLVQKLLRYKEELFIGSNRDGDSNVYAQSGKGFGHLLVFGKGGIYTEIYKDHAMVLVPATRQQLLSALAKTRVSGILAGARGNPPLALPKLFEVFDSIQRLVTAYPEIASLDINPLVISEREVYALDVKIYVKS